MRHNPVGFGQAGNDQIQPLLGKVLAYPAVKLAGAAGNFGLAAQRAGVVVYQRFDPHPQRQGIGTGCPQQQQGDGMTPRRHRFG